MKSIKEYLTFKSKGQKVFVIIKPGFLQYSGEIMEKLKESGWVVDRTITKKLMLSEANNLYKVNNEESF